MSIKTLKLLVELPIDSDEYCRISEEVSELLSVAQFSNILVHFRDGTWKSCSEHQYNYIKMPLTGYVRRLIFTVKDCPEVTMFLMTIPSSSILKD